MDVSVLTPTCFSFLVVTYNSRDLESNPTTAMNSSCEVGESWYLYASLFHLLSVANIAFSTMYHEITTSLNILFDHVYTVPRTT